MFTLCKIEEKPESIICKLRKDNKIIFKEFPFNNFFYIEEKDYDEIEYLLNRNVLRTEIIKDKYKTFVKLYLKNNYHRNIIKNKLEDDFNIKTYEADIPSGKRFLLLNNKEDLNQDKLEVAFIDIETFDLNSLQKDFDGKVIAVDPILCVAIKDTKGKIHFVKNKGLEGKEEYYKANWNKIKELKNEVIELLFKGEKQMLIELSSIIKNYDVMLAWNGNRFDFPYLQQRFQKHGLNYKDLFLVDMDYMEVYKKNQWVSLRSYSLNFVSEYEFKDEIKKEVSVFKNLTEVTKIDWKEKTGCKKFFELFLFDIGVMKEYNIQDVNLMFLIEEKIKFLKIHQIQAKIAHCLLIDTLYNSKIIDMLLLNEYHKKNIIKNSKPSKKQVEGFSHPITGEFISGGYTFCYLPGLYKDLECWDFGSHYPTAIITHNISPELYVDDYYPKLQEIFKENEVKFINEVINLNPMYLKNAKNVKYLTSKGTLNKKRYEKKIEELRKKYNVKITMEDAMWKIVEHKDEKLKKYLIKNNLTRTDWDLNLDTRGWNLHPARLFKREEGILPMLCKDLLQKRNIIKYSLKNYEKNSPEYEEKNIYQTALKNLANSIYGVFGLKTFRDYKYAIGDCITTTCRMLTKKCILAGRKKGLTITSGDTDSIYGIKNENNLQDLNEFYFNFFNNWIKDFNSFCTFNLINPKTNKTETCKHAKNFEHEKTFDACIVVKKKRYYYILDGEINSKGGMFIKKDTIQIAKDLQKKLCKDLLTFKYNKKDWHEKLLKYKKIVYDQKLYKKFIIKYQTINKPLDTYGQHVIDGKTGKPKIKKDGTNQYAPIPAHIQVAKRLIEQGEDINIGDSISYIVYKSKPKIQPITIDEFENGKQYDSDYYWKAIISGILELFRVVEKENIYTYFKDCWQYTPKQLERLLNKLENE